MGSTLDAPTSLQAVGMVERFGEPAAELTGERPLTAARQATTSAQSACPSRLVGVCWPVEGDSPRDAHEPQNEMSSHGRAKRRNRPVDVLVQVRLLSGAEQWILLHAEVQSSPEAGFERRVARYHSGLFWVHDQRVITLVVLADLREDWRPGEDLFRVADFESRLRFPTCKLIDRLETDWRDDHSLPVQMARAQIEALRTASDPEGRYRAKSRLVRKLYDLGYNAEELRQIFRLIDWMMHLTETLSQRFEQELREFEESLNMPYVTSVERIAEARGEARGAQAPASCCGSLPRFVDLCRRTSRIAFAACRFNRSRN